MRTERSGQTTARGARGGPDARQRPGRGSDDGLEEYYTLGVMVRAGIGTNHLDGNTRLCTATAGESLKESFGCDGQPGSYADVDHADVIVMYGHNMAETQAVT